MEKRFVLKGQAYRRSKEEVEDVLKDVQPDAIHKYYIVINGIQYPPKQVLGIALQLGRVEFTTMDAANILKRLGFKIEII